MDQMTCRIGLICLLAALTAAAYGKTSGPDYYTPQQVKLARERVQTEDWAKSHLDGLKSRVAYVVKLNDEELWRFIPPADLVRATFLWRGQSTFAGCPVCGKKIFDVGRGGFYPWLYDREHPWKVQCPSCKTWFPSSDFAAYYENGMQGECDMSGDYPDDGSGWVNKDGIRHYFVGYWCQHQRWADVIRAISDLCEIHLLTGDEAYARPAAILLSRFATVYPDTDYPKQSNYSADGRVLPWCWENTSVVRPVAIAYDSVWPYMHTTGDHGLLDFLKSKGVENMCAHVDKGFLQDVADKMMTTESYISNEGDHQRAYAIVALVWGDNDPAHGITTDQMLDWLLNGRGSMDTLIWNGIYPDGHPNEASPGYSSSVAEKSWEIADYLTRAGHNLFDNPRFPASAHVWLDLCMCGKQQPAIGDYGNIFGGGRAGWSAAMFRTAWERFKDPRFAKALVALGNPRPDLYDPDIRAEVAAAAAKYDRPLVGGTRNLSQFGCAILEGGAEPYERALSLYYGSAAGGHGHYDRLNIELYAHGRTMMPDLGYPDQWGAKASQFHCNSTGHYTVQIDERGHMNKQRGELKFVADLDDVQVGEASAEGTYPGIADIYRRTTALVDVSPTDSYVLDAFRVKGGHKHDWLFHGPAYDGFAIQGVDLSQPREGTLAGPDVPLGKVPEGYQGSGYHWLHSVQSGTPSGEWTATYTGADEDPQLKMTMLPGAADEVIVAQFDSPHISGRPMPDSLPWIVARNETEGTSRFVSIIRTVTGEDCIEMIEPLAVSENDSEALALRVTTAEYTDTIYGCMDGDLTVSVGDGIEIAARFALIRRDRAGQLVSVHAVGCNSLGGPDFAIESEGRHRGDVTAVDAAARTVTVAGFPLTDALVGQSVLFANELHQTNFQVESVSGGDGKVVLGLGYVSPMIGHGTVYDVDDQNRVLLTDTTFRNYGCQDIWSKGFDPKLEGMYLLNGDRSKHFLINDCQLFPDVSKEWWQPEADHGSFNLAGTEKLSDTFKKGGEWYVQALWPGDVAWVENALVLQVQGQQVYRLSTTSTHIVLKVGKADGKVVYKATGATPGVHTVTAKDGRVELGAAMLQSGEGIVILNPNPRVDYSDCDPPRLVEMSADGKAVQYEKGMAPAAGGARQVRLVFGDANSLEPPTIAIAGVAVPATGRGVKTEKLTKATTAITLDLQALAAWAAAKEIAYPPVLQVAVRDSALNPEPCAVSLTLAALAAPGEGAIFLSDLKPVSSLAHAGLKNDRNYAGEPGVNLRGRHFDKAIMTCPETGHAAETIYDLASHPDHRIFQAVVGLDDAVGTRGTAAFEVYVDGPDDGWQKLHATRVLSGGGDVLALRIDLGQAKKLRLVVTEGGDGIGSDHAVWADARLELGD